MSYATILEKFKQRAPAVRSVVFCDYEGESIEFVTDLDSYHTQLLGAYQSEILHSLAALHRAQQAGGLRSMSIETDGTFWSITMLKEGYYVVAMSSRNIPPTHPALVELMHDLNAQL
jgi:hypothetical protein